MKKTMLLPILLLFILFPAFGQKKYDVKTIAFYNLENLFDIENDTLINDEASPIMDIKENRAEVYQKKLDNMAKVIAEIGFEDTKNSPIILGVAEVENRKVLEDLTQTDILKDKKYEIVHYDSKDLRGIDVGFLYQPAFFTPTHHEVFELKLFEEGGMRIYTRDILLVSGYLDGELMHFIVNHWPSRRGGEKKSRWSREKAAYLNTQIIEQIKLSDPTPKVVIMGDLNDDPINSSLKKVLKTKAKKSDVLEGDIYNPMEDMFKRGQNTLAYRDNINLFDQILISSPLLTGNKEFPSYKMYKVGIFNPTYLTTQTGKFKGYPYRSWGYNGFTNGYSDHYPVYMYLIKEL